MNSKLFSVMMVVFFLSIGTSLIVYCDYPEFKVNTYTNDVQSSSNCAMDDDGNFVIVWQSMGQDGSGWGIFAQRYKYDGSKDGDEFQVNTYTSGHQAYPSAAMDSLGNFIISWQSNDQDGSGFGIYTQRYKNDGSKDGNEIQLNKFIDGDQKNPSAAMDKERKCVISWQSSKQNCEDGKDDIYFKLLIPSDLKPTPTPTKTSTRTATATLSYTPIPTATPTPTGNDQKPILNNGRVIPVSGYSKNDFEYQVNFKDPDGGKPLVTILLVNDSVKTMKLNKGSKPYDGLYFFTCPGKELNIGTNKFSFLFTDDESNTITLPEEGKFDGPKVEAIGFELPFVDIYSNGTYFGAGESIQIKVLVDNKTSTSIDMYAVLIYENYYYWYPMWNKNSISTEIEPGVWDNEVAVIPISDDIPAGTYTFYAAITEHDTVNVLGLDAVTITIY